MTQRSWKIGLAIFGLIVSGAIVLAGDPNPPTAPNKCRYVDLADPTHVICKPCPFKDPSDNVMFCSRFYQEDGYNFRNFTDACEDCVPSGPQP